MKIVKTKTTQTKNAKKNLITKPMYYCNNQKIIFTLKKSTKKQTKKNY